MKLSVARQPEPGITRILEERSERTSLDLGLASQDLPPDEAPPALPDDEESRPLSLAEHEERRQLEAALDAAGGVVARAAAQLGISRQALYRRMKRLGLAFERRITDG